MSEPEHAPSGCTRTERRCQFHTPSRPPWPVGIDLRTVAVTGSEWRERNGSNFYRLRTHHEKVDNCGPSEADVRDDGDCDDDALPLLDSDKKSRGAIVKGNNIITVAATAAAGHDKGYQRVRAACMAGP